MKKIVHFSLLVFITLFYSLSIRAGHVHYGQVNWECLNNGKYVFHLEVVLECYSPYSFSNHQLNVGGSPLPTDINNNVISQITMRPDSNKWMINNNGDMSPVCGSDIANGSIDCSNGALRKFYFKSDSINLNGTPPSNGWLFSWTAPCCPLPTQNLTGNPSGTSSAVMYQNPNKPNDCFDSSPKFITPLSEPNHCNGELSINFAATDQENDSLVYNWERASSSYATGYSYNNPLPDSNINSGNRAAFLNSSTGLIDARVNNSGSYILGVRIDAWRNDTLIASTYRERRVVVQSCATLPNNNQNDLPILFLGANTNNLHQLRVKAGDSIQLPIILSDTNSTASTSGLQSVKIIPEGAMFAADFQDTTACENPPCATLVTPSPVYDSSEYRFSLGDIGAVGTNFKWNTSCNHLTDSGETKKYYFYVLGKDDHCPLPAVNHGVIEVEVEPLYNQGVQQSNDTLISLDSVQAYQWLNCDSNSIITGETSQQFVPTSSGNYSVILQNGNCTDTSDCIAYTTVGLRESNFENSVNLFPNPTNGLVNIEVDQKQEDLQIKVRNIHGQLVQEDQFVNQSNMQLQLNGEAGIYFIELINGEGKRVNLKVVKR